MLQRAERHRPERFLSAERATFGFAEIGGDAWPVGDTGFIASWISGSEYVKIQTGVLLFFPRDMHLYQGPLPNAQLVDGSGLDVMAGLEYSTKDRLWPHEGTNLGWSSINVIVRLPPVGQTVEVAAGDPLCWAFLVPGRSALRLSKLPLGADHAGPPTEAP